jgi:hypothetical protein
LPIITEKLRFDFVFEMLVMGKTLKVREVMLIVIGPLDEIQGVFHSAPLIPVKELLRCHAVSVLIEA